MAAQWRAGRGYNLLIVIVSHHALHKAAADYYRQENKPALYFTISVDDFIPKKCLLGLCLECETFIRGVFCPNLFVCVCVCLCVCVFVCVCVCPLFLKKQIIAGGPLGPPVIFFYNILHTININIHFQIKLKNFLGPKILSWKMAMDNISTMLVRQW